MKRKRPLIVFTALLAVLLFLSACSQNSASGNKQNTGPDGAPRGQGPRQPDFGQPDRQPDIRGIVKSIVGNEATILKVDLRGGPGAGQTTSSTEAANAANTRPVPAVSLNGGAPAGGPNQGRGFGVRIGAEGSGTDRADRLAQLKELSTGEEKVLIPVGIQMLKAPTGTDSRTMVEATISDVTADKTITIWLDNSVTDKKVAEFVLIN